MNHQQLNRQSLWESANASFSNPVVTGLLGVSAGFLVCWFFMALPLQANLQAREKSLQEWERINRTEREAVADMKTISIQELKSWVATIDAQNVRYAELTRRLHQQEIELSGPATTQLFIALAGLLGVTGFVVWMLRDSNAEAATTLSNAIAVLPALKDSLQARHAPALEIGAKPAIAQSAAHGGIADSEEA